MGVIDFMSASIPLHDDLGLAYKRLSLNAIGYKELTRVVDVPDFDLGVGLYTEMMANVPNSYNGSLGKFAPAWTRPPDSLWQTSPRYIDPLKTVPAPMPSYYMGEGVVAT